MRKQAPRHDMAAAHKAQAVGAVLLQHLPQNLRRPWACGIYQHACLHHVLHAGFGILQRNIPMGVTALGGHNAGARANSGATFSGVAGIQADQAAILHPAIGIFEGLRKLRLQGRAFGAVVQRQAARGG